MLTKRPWNPEAVRVELGRAAAAAVASWPTQLGPITQRYWSQHRGPASPLLGCSPARPPQQLLPMVNE